MTGGELLREQVLLDGLTGGTGMGMGLRRGVVWRIQGKLLSVVLRGLVYCLITPS